MRTKNLVRSDNMNEQASRHHRLLLDEDVERIFAKTDYVAEGTRKIGTRLRFLSDVSEYQHLKNRMKGPVAQNDDVNW